MLHHTFSQSVSATTTTTTFKLLDRDPCGENAFTTVYSDGGKSSGPGARCRAIRVKTMPLNVLVCLAQGCQAAIGRQSLKWGSHFYKGRRRQVVLRRGGMGFSRLSHTHVETKQQEGDVLAPYRSGSVSIVGTSALWSFCVL